ncbi:MAG: HicB family protein [Oscillospiraceae bacterium]|nr:HicB family protein [Oscillospiraceae bacterium]
MKTCYSIIITTLPENECTPDASYLVYAPNFEINTEGRDLSDTFDMAREAIELCGVTIEDEKRVLPKPSDISDIKCGGELKLLVDVDFNAYRNKLRGTIVKRSCKIPMWLSDRAEQTGTDLSLVLQNALMEQLNIKQED